VDIHVHLFTQDPGAILDATNQAVSRLHPYAADNGKNPAV
jgi:hypothetical protein